MRIAVISDIHGNLVALDAVLADIDRSRPDALVCLGDVVESGPQPREVLARLRAIGSVNLMGNTDERVLSPQPYEPPNEHARRSAEIEAWCVGLLGAEDRALMRSFQATATLALDHSTRLLCFHGSPRSNTEVIRATTPEAELEPMLADAAAQVLIGGHTHTQMLRRHRTALIVNAGSVGLPFELIPGGVRRPPWAEYAMIEARDGGLRVDLRRVPIDLTALARAARASSMPHTEWWLELWSA